MNICDDCMYKEYEEDGEEYCIRYCTEEFENDGEGCNEFDKRR